MEAQPGGIVYRLVLVPFREPVGGGRWQLQVSRGDVTFGPEPSFADFLAARRFVDEFYPRPPPWGTASCWPGHRALTLTIVLSFGSLKIYRCSGRVGSGPSGRGCGFTAPCEATDNLVSGFVATLAVDIRRPARQAPADRDIERAKLDGKIKTLDPLSPGWSDQVLDLQTQIAATQPGKDAERIEWVATGDARLTLAGP
jgi:hypothetical protein